MYKLFKYEIILSTSFLAYLWLLYWSGVYEGKRSWKKNDMLLNMYLKEAIALSRSSLYLGKKKLGEKYQNLVWWSYFNEELVSAPSRNDSECESMELSKEVIAHIQWKFGEKKEGMENYVPMSLISLRSCNPRESPLLVRLSPEKRGARQTSRMVTQLL